MERLVEEGYLTTELVQVTHGYYTEYTRTTKQPPVYRPRPYLRKVITPEEEARRNDPFPWDRKHHWQIIEETPDRVAHRTAQTLLNKPVVYYYDNYAITNLWMLNRARKLVEHSFRYGHMCNLAGKIGVWDRLAAENPIEIRIYLLEMRLEAEFDGDRFVRFVPTTMSPEEAHEEWLQLRRANQPTDARQRYVNLMRILGHE